MSWSCLNAVLFLLLVLDDRTWQNDFAAYYLAAGRMLGGPFQAIDPAFYLYPPFLAQMLVPMTLLPLAVAKTDVAAGLLRNRLRRDMGRRRDRWRAPRPRTAMWCLAATLLFPPVVMAAWQGNVGTIVSLSTVLVAAGGAVAGVGAAVGLGTAGYVLWRISMLADDERGAEARPGLPAATG